MERFAGGAIPAKLFRGYEAQFSRTEGLLLGPSGAWNLVPDPWTVKRKSLLLTRSASGFYMPNIPSYFNADPRPVELTILTRVQRATTPGRAEFRENLPGPFPGEAPARMGSNDLHREIRLSDVGAPPGHGSPGFDWVGSGKASSGACLRGARKAALPAASLDASPPRLTARRRRFRETRRGPGRGPRSESGSSALDQLGALRERRSTCGSRGQRVQGSAVVHALPRRLSRSIQRAVSPKGPALTVFCLREYRRRTSARAVLARELFRLR